MSTENTSPAAPQKRRRWLRWVLALLATGVILPVAALTFLTSSTGEKWIKNKGLALINESLRGQFELESFTWDGTEFTLRHIDIRDPEGLLVAHVGRLHLKARPSFPQLTHVQIQELALEAFEVKLQSDERGLNIQRAFSSRQPPKDEPPGNPPSFRVTLHQVKFQEGHIQFDRLSEKPTSLDISELQLDLAGDYAHPSTQFEVHSTLQANLQKPDVSKVELTLKATGDLTHLTEGSVRLSAGKAQIDAELESNAEKETLFFELKRFELPAELAQTLVENYPLKVPVSAQGQLSDAQGVTALQLSATAGKAQFQLSGQANLAAMRLQNVKLEGKHIDLSEWWEGQKSDLAVAMEADLQALSSKTLSGKLSLNIPESPFDAQRVGPVAVRATAQDGRVKLSELTARVPGARLEGSGEGVADDFRFSGGLSVTDFKPFGKTLSSLTGTPLTPMTGKGELNVTTQGSWAHPEVFVAGELPSFRRADVAIESLSLNAHWNDLRKFVEAQAQLRAGVITFGPRTFREVAVDVATLGKNVEATVSAKALGEMVLALNGQLDDAKQTLQVSKLDVRYPEETWTLKAPTTISWGENVLALAPLTLQAPGQSLSAQFRQRGSLLKAEVKLDAFKLEKLPRAFVGNEWNLAGALSLQGRLEGTEEAPLVDVGVQLENGRFRGSTGLAGTLEAHFEDDRAVGNLKGASSVGTLTASFTAPVRGFVNRRDVPLRVDLEFAQIRLDQLLPEKASGEGLVRASLSGTASAPKLQVKAQVKDAQWLAEKGKWLAVPSAQVDLSTQEDRSLKLSGQAQAFEGQTSFSLQTPWTLYELLDSPPTFDRLRRTPLQTTLDVESLQLASVAASGWMEPLTKGALTLRHRSNGALNELDSQTELTVPNLEFEKAPPLASTVRLSTNASKINLIVDVLRQTQPLLHSEGEFTGPVSALIETPKRTITPFSWVTKLTGLTLQDLQALRGQTQSAESISGPLRAEMLVKGTLRQPEWSAVLEAPAIAVKNATAGNLRVDYAYNGGDHLLKARAQSNQGGQLQAQAQTHWVLSSDAKMSDWKQAPLQASLRSQALDLRVLSGLLPSIRAIAGTLEANLQVDGRLGSPKPKGDVEWNDGRVSTVGYGDYRHMHLKAEGASDRITLHEWVAQAGGGNLKVKAEAKRDGATWSFESQVEAKRVPVVMDDQLYAYLSTELTAEGEWVAGALTVRDLSINKGIVELPETQRKDLQDLDRPDDIVLVKQGRPVYRVRSKAGEEDSTVASETTDESSQRVSVSVNAPRGIFVKASDLNVELGLSPDFRIDVREKTYVQGEMSVSGRMDVYSRRFDVQKGSSVKFSGPASSPYFNVLAEHRNEREQVTVFVTVSGRGKNFALKTSSMPALPDSEIYTLLMTGRRTLKRGSGPAMPGDAAMSIVGAAAASIGKNLLAGKLPLDMLSVETGEKGLSQLRVEGGTYLSPRAYLGASWQLGANPERGENTLKGTFEYQFSPQWGVEASYGDANAGGAELIWSREY